MPKVTMAPKVKRRATVKPLGGKSLKFAMVRIKYAAEIASLKEEIARMKLGECQDDDDQNVLMTAESYGCSDEAGASVCGPRHGP